MPHHLSHLCFLFFFNDTATTEIYTLSLHDALPISARWGAAHASAAAPCSPRPPPRSRAPARPRARSEEHTSELQSRSDLVCRLLLEKKKRRLKHHIFGSRLASDVVFVTHTLLCVSL